MVHSARLDIISRDSGVRAAARFAPSLLAPAAGPRCSLQDALRSVGVLVAMAVLMVMVMRVRSSVSVDHCLLSGPCYLLIVDCPAVQHADSRWLRHPVQQYSNPRRIVPMLRLRTAVHPQRTPSLRCLSGCGIHLLAIVLSLVNPYRGPGALKAASLMVSRPLVDTAAAARLVLLSRRLWPCAGSCSSDGRDESSRALLLIDFWSPAAARVSLEAEARPSDCNGPVLCTLEDCILEKRIRFRRRAAWTVLTTHNFAHPLTHTHGHSSPHLLALDVLPSPQSAPLPATDNISPNHTD
ncbi:hypothetical protein EXIGLDRAFT_430304 [Exidia glandulosa HHB12029]|uniref:Uncharacterized protein n=1 Tax=Exidia glandulosa HHB12029 TaxID=1314781 RepID=A0A165BB00_EXIGL|nr:hypothetical protein EXIGLDRAFT_430304 [Exidia glandulosa HHB12029]